MFLRKSTELIVVLVLLIVLVACCLPAWNAPARLGITVAPNSKFEGKWSHEDDQCLTGAARKGPGVPET